MTSFLLAAQNAPFAVALALMVGIGFLELVSFIMGAGVSEMLEGVLPEMNDVDFDVDADVSGNVDSATAGADSVGAALRALSWLGLGKVPVLILTVIFLCAFGLSGLVLQFLLLKLTAGSFMLPAPIAWLPALAVSLPLVRWSARAFARIMPKEETSAVSTNTFVGRVAVVINGVARVGSPAQAKLHDHFGQTHYVMVEPDEESKTFETGATVVLVKHLGAVFQAIRNPSDALVD